MKESRKDKLLFVFRFILLLFHLLFVSIMILSFIGFVLYYVFSVFLYRIEFGLIASVILLLLLIGFAIVNFIVRRILE